LGYKSAIDFTLLQAAHLLGESLRRLHLEHLAHAAFDVVERLRAVGEAHAPVPNWSISSGCCDLGISNRARGPPALMTRVDDLPDLKVRVDLGGDAKVLAFELEQRDQPRGRPARPPRSV
jgi:hypothetical protein